MSFLYCLLMGMWEQSIIVYYLNWIFTCTETEKGAYNAKLTKN